ALGISRSGGARNPHVFQYTLRFLRSGGTRPSFARDGFSQTLRACEKIYCARNLTFRRCSESSCISLYTPGPALRRNATFLRSRRFFTSSHSSMT
ncbi:MAG: hypothetical protein ACREYE_12510, partial [Gammaproteobacteria bacterium]